MSTEKLDTTSASITQEMFLEVKNDTLAILSKSTIPIEAEHALDTVAQLLKINPQASLAEQTAALLHDIDRGLSPTPKIDTQTYEMFKGDHAARSADAARHILEANNYPPKTTETIVAIILLHETGGAADNDRERYQTFFKTEENIPLEVLGAATDLMDADSVSFFSGPGLIWYAKSRENNHVINKIQYMYQRASSRAQELIREVMANHSLSDQFKQALPTS